MHLKYNGDTKRVELAQRRDYWAYSNLTLYSKWRFIIFVRRCNGILYYGSK